MLGFLSRRNGTGKSLLAIAVLGGMAIVLHAEQLDPPWSSGIAWPEPKLVDPGPPGGPPSDAIVLFDGKDMASHWEGAEKWTIENGYAIDGGNLRTRQSFGDCQMHIEWASPAEVKGTSQQRGNSGVHFMDMYEIQILDSYQNETYFDGQAGAVYKQRPPLVNACRKPGEWQTYDIIFKAPRFSNNGELLNPAYVTVLQNGVLIQDHFEILGETAYRKPPKYTPHPPKLPIVLQYHGCPVRFRNIWIRELGDDHSDLLIPLREKVKQAAAS